MACLDIIVQLREDPDCLRKGRIPRFPLTKPWALKQATHALLLPNFVTFCSLCGYTLHSEMTNKSEGKPTNQLIWICEILGRRHVVSYLGLNHRLCFKKQSRLCVLQHHLQQVT